MRCLSDFPKVLPWQVVTILFYFEIVERPRIEVTRIEGCFKVSNLNVCPAGSEWAMGILIVGFKSEHPGRDSDKDGSDGQKKHSEWGVRTDAGEWERLHTLHSGGCGFQEALLPV